jgi:outer membrane protein assembly factor BamB
LWSGVNCCFAYAALLWTFSGLQGLNAQTTTHFSGDQVQVAWQVFTNPVGKGNGAFMSPRGDTLVVVSSNGVVRALNAADGEALWSFPSTPGVTSSSGAFFNTNAPVPYVAYCITSGGAARCVCVCASAGVVNHALAYPRVCARSPCDTFALARRSAIVGINLATGAEVFSTGAMNGVCVGTPVTTANGRYVMTTHNVGGAKGFFSVFDVQSPFEAVFSYDFPDVEAPFGPVGYFWDPLAGYYDGGENNGNDIFVWGLASPSVNGTFGQVFAFQLPVENMDFKVALVGGERDFFSPNPPIITNEGFSMYWSVSRSEQRCWVGGQGLGRRNFGTDGVNTIGFERGQPAQAAAAAPLTLSSYPTMPFVVGPTAANQLVRLSFDFSEDAAAPTVRTALQVQNRVLISRDDSRVYYTTPAPDGNLYSIDSTSLQQFWNVSIAAGVVGEIALSLNGDTVYVADALGGVTAFVVAVAPPISLAPTVSPINQTAPPVSETFSPAPISIGGAPAPVAAPSLPPTVTTGSPVSPAPSGSAVRINTEAPTISMADISPTSLPSFKVKPTKEPTRGPASTSNISKAPAPAPSAPAPSMVPTALAPTTDAMDDAAFETAINTPIQIPSRARSGETTNVLDWPLRGSLTINSDGSITYVPRTGFFGADSFNLEICEANQACRVERITITVLDARSADTASNLLYLLSLLALVPIGILAVVCYKRLGDPAKPKVESTPSDVEAAEIHGPNDDEPREPASPNEDVPGEPASPTVPISVVARRIDAKQDSVPRPQQSDPLAAPPLVSATARLVADDGPDYKDQCRLEPSGKRLNPPAPLANALWVQQEDMDKMEA